MAALNLACRLNPLASRLKVKEMMTFVPSGKDFDLALRFYRELGFHVDWQSVELALIHIDTFRFFLQNFENKEMQANFMLNLEGESVDDWWSKLEGLNLKEKFPGIRVKAPEVYPWGKKEIHLIDPSGVFWHIAMRA